MQREKLGQADNVENRYVKSVSTTFKLYAESRVVHFTGDRY